MRNNIWEKYKNIFLNIKQKIDKTVESQGIVFALSNQEGELDLAFSKCKKSFITPQDRNFLCFNYYPCKAMITLSKGWKYKSLIECLEGYKFLLSYIKNISSPQKWLKSFDYYRSRLKIITNRHLEIFGNTGNKQVGEILNHFEEIINLGLNLPQEIDKRCLETILEVIKDIILKSSEIYTEEHLNRKREIINLLNKVPINDDYVIGGTVYQINFILSKKHLFFLLRDLIPHRKRRKCTLEAKIRSLINELKNISGKEKNIFNKTDDEFKKFLAKIDVFTANYYNQLWISKNLINAVKILEDIFKEIRKNIKLISSFSLFDYFINEYLFIINFIKLLLIKKDFEDFSSKTNMKWQNQLAQNVKESLEKSIKYFKFSPATIESRKLLIIQEEITGKFMEFMTFYLLKEIAFKILKENELKNKVSSQKIEINEILKLIKECSNPDVDIQLNKQQNGTDIDVLIKSKYAIFIKTGIISGSDKTKIKNELEVATKAKYNPYVILDIGKNFSVVNFLNKLNKDSVKIIDVGEFFEEIYRISQDLKILIGLSRSAIKSFAGFTGG